MEFHLAMQVLSDDQIVDLTHPHCMYDIFKPSLKLFEYILVANSGEGKE